MPALALSPRFLLSAKRRLCLLLAALALFAFPGCLRTGDLAPGLGSVLASDAAQLAAGAPERPGVHPVEAKIFDREQGPRFSFAVYRPADLEGPLPAVVFLPGLMAPESQYESYGRWLASWGFVVAVRGWYGPLKGDHSLAQDARQLADWLVRRGLADSAKLGLAGHSRGGKDAILAASLDSRFRAVVALDPDDQGGLSVIASALPALEAKLLLVGSEVGWKGAQVCAPKAHNYQRFFEASPAGTVELELAGADHVQLLDDPEALGMSICRKGSADSRSVRSRARLAMASFFAEHLAGQRWPAAPESDQVRTRVR